MTSTVVTSMTLPPDIEVPEHYGDWLGEYRAACAGVALVDRRDRAWVELRGEERAPWLHNLVTNGVLYRKPGEGGYAFAANAKGRVVFDLHYLVGAEAIWLDIDRRWLTAALAHLDHYVITEDVTVTDSTPDFARLALCGPDLRPLFADLGVAHIVAMNIGQHIRFRLAGIDVVAFRSDFVGPIGVELVVPSAQGKAVWDALLGAGREHGISPVGWRALQALRIERGVPWSCEDIDGEVIPLETGRTADGISYNKGCYVGHEVIERMRSHGALARKLVGVRLDSATVPSRGDEILVAGAKTGRITSACYSPALDAPLALGYIAREHAAVGTPIRIQHAGVALDARLIDLPLRQPS
jgi:folate-binding protein YgfZ